MTSVLVVAGAVVVRLGPAVGDDGVVWRVA